tara:strand:- start:7 stop:1212 length:1206 start_codon:yes stop_codon:yes gene_type:complete
MKLFKSLLVAPAALGLLAPMTATANELNLTDVSDYSSSKEVKSISEFYPKQLAITAGRVDGLEARMNNYEAGGFSSTTSASFSADFAVGAVEGSGITTSDKDNGTEAIAAVYGFQIDLTTSFTGEDSLDISIDAGNAGAPGVAEYDLNGTTDALQIDGVSYSFPIGDKTSAFVGAQGTDGSSAFTVACTYGGPSNTLDDCGNVQSGFNAMSGSSLGASYAVTDELSIAIGYAGNGVDSSKGLMTAEGLDAVGINASYITDTYGISATYSSVETSLSVAGETIGYNDASVAFNGYWSPEGFPSISTGYEFTDIGGVAETVDEKTSWFLGLQFDEIGPGSGGLAVGTQGSIIEGNDEALMYEAYYSYPVNDGMTITPLVYAKEKTSSTDEDETGVMVKTSFSF